MRRTGGLLVPGFSKTFDHVAGCGVTWWLGVRIGAFDVVRLPAGGTELRYRTWPVVDLLEGHPRDDTGPVSGCGTFRLGGTRRLRFCTFVLEPARTRAGD